MQLKFKSDKRIKKKYAFILSFIFTKVPLLVLVSLCLLSYYQALLAFRLNNISYQVGLPATILLVFVYLWMNILILLSILKDDFAGYKILGWQFFFLSFSSLNISSDWLLNSTVSHEKSAVNLIWGPLYRLSHFSLSTFNISSWPSSFYYDVSQCGSLCIAFILFGVCWATWIFRLIFFIKYGKFSNIISSRISFLFSPSVCWCMWPPPPRRSVALDWEPCLSGHIHAEWSFCHAEMGWWAVARVSSTLTVPTEI